MGFSTFWHSFTSVIVQTTGELDYSSLFLEGSLLYSAMAYILFIVFIVLMPILFNNLLVSLLILPIYCIFYVCIPPPIKIGLAVTATDEELGNAEFNNIKVQVCNRCFPKYSYAIVIAYD